VRLVACINAGIGLILALVLTHGETTQRVMLGERSVWRNHARCWTAVLNSQVGIKHLVRAVLDVTGRHHFERHNLSRTELSKNTGAL
jgi:hypothetical protein